MIPIKTTDVRITSYYGNREYMYRGKLIKDFHHGIDLVPKNFKGNEEIIAFYDGVVTGVQKVGKQYGTGCYVRIKHDKGLYTLYYHLKSETICVNVGDKVVKGQKLGIIGTTGQSTGVHLHFQIDKGNNSTSINPYDYVFNNKELIQKTGYDNYTDEQLAVMVWHGYFGNGQERKNKLGDRYESVQKIVNLQAKQKQEKINNDELLNLVRKTIRGDFGNGQERKNKLGTKYDIVQKQVNLNIKNGNTSWNNIKLY